MCPSAATRLLGPPGIGHALPSSQAAVASSSSSSPSSSTDNYSTSHETSGDACLDFFFHVVPDTPSEAVASLIAAAWDKDPLTALKLVCHLRGVRDTGKADREGFYASALWLHKNHPRTLALNVASFVEFGCMKDLLEILFRLLEGPDTREGSKARHLRAKTMGPAAKPGSRKTRRGRYHRQRPSLGSLTKMEIPEQGGRSGGSIKRKRDQLAVRALERFAGDQAYQFLHDCVAEFFASLLASDLDQLRRNNLNKIGLAAKWCPSPDSSFDEATLICESIARKMFPRESDPKYEDIEEEHYVYRIRCRLRREVLVPLRKVLDLPEVHMSAGQWDSFPYERVASAAMKKYKEIFLKHRKAEFESFLEEMKEGKSQVAAGALLPHEILGPAFQGEDDEVAELQWRRMVGDLSRKGKWTNCIAACNVAKGTRETSFQACVALSLLISELSEEPWKGKLITVDAATELQLIEGESLREKILSCMNGSQLSSEFGVRGVFDRILQVAVDSKLPPEKMIRRVFVFNVTDSNRLEIDYDAICRKFGESGYGAAAVPEIVFWNLTDSGKTPVISTQKGVALLSGFSKNLFKLFVESEGQMSPEMIMESAIAGEEYHKVVVYD